MSTSEFAPFEFYCEYCNQRVTITPDSRTHTCDLSAIYRKKCLICGNVEPKGYQLGYGSEFDGCMVCYDCWCDFLYPAIDKIIKEGK